MYGQFRNYFKISGGWYLIKREIEGDIIKQYCIYPVAAITDGSNPVNLITATRDSCIAEYYGSHFYYINDFAKYHTFIDETKFHYLDASNVDSVRSFRTEEWRNIFYDEDPFWDSKMGQWRHYHCYDKGYLCVDYQGYYNIVEKKR